MNTTLEQSAAQTDLTPLNRIRVETALSRFPIHRLAKKGSISIDLLRISDAGEADFKWEVTYNVKHGQPGPLAYKVDTLVVNRRIDEVKRPIPELIKLGSLSEICRILGSSDSGPNISDLRKAFLQNASVFINAKIRYTPKNKSTRERWAEIGYTRYSVIFTGEELPDGSKADAVYLVLNPPYRDFLNRVEFRPLDYDYLAQLPPGPQRFYELASFQVFGAIASGRARARLLYSEYCLYAPQTRYCDWEHVRKQMYKVHVPHLKSGYIVKVDYQQTHDRDGNADWEMLYTPGPKAMAEYQSFTNRQVRQQSPALPRSILDSNAQQPVQTTLELTDDDHQLLIELIHRGITDKKARELIAEQVPGQEIMNQIEWTDSIIAKAPAGKFHNPPGLYVATIRDNVTPPATFLSSRKRWLQQEAQQAKNAEMARHAQRELTYAEYQSQVIDSYITELPRPEYQQMLLEARRQLKRTYATMTEPQLEELATNWVRANVKNSGSVRVLGFEEFCAANS